jgi:anion-transporting  ArsA/GET3 family ATPase
LLAELDHLGLKPQALFVNRTILAEDAATCARCRIAAKWQAAVLAKLEKRHSTEEIFAIRNFPNEIAGETGLRTITHELWRLT